MGRLVTKGTAKAEFEAEVLTLTVTFTKTGLDSKTVLDGVQEEVENFLNELVKISVEPEQINIEDNGLSRRRYGEEELTAEKVITIKTKIDVRFCSYVFSLIKSCRNTIRYDISYDLIDKAELQKALLQEAVEDSRRQAEIISRSLGKDIIDVESINDQSYLPRNLAKSICVGDDINPDIPEAFLSDTPLADRAGLPTVELEEEVSIAWII